MLQNQLPIFSTFGQDIMASDIVATAISCIVDEMIKCKPMHVKQIGKEIEPQFSEITKVLEHPNDLMTTADFISKIVFIYETKNNVFIYPQFEFYMDKGIEVIDCRKARFDDVKMTAEEDFFGGFFNIKIPPFLL